MRKSWSPQDVTLEKALISADLETLNDIITVAQEKINTYKHQQTYNILREDF